MRIAILHTAFNNYGGAERVIVNLTKGLIQRGHYVEVIACGFNNQEIRQFFIEHQIPYHFPPINRLINFSHHYRIAGWLLSPYLRDFEVINVHNYPTYVWLNYALPWLRDPPPKIIWICHEPPKDLYPEILLPHAMKSSAFLRQHLREYPERHVVAWRQEDQKAVAKIDKIICNSLYIKQAIRQIYQKEAAVINFGVNMEKWNKEKITSPPRESVAVSLSRLEPAKNFDIVLQAIRIIKESHLTLANKIKVVIAGTGSDEKRLKQLTRKLNLEAIVSFPGYLPEEKIPEFYGTANFVLYLPLDEPMGLIPLEAGFFGRPTLGSRQGGMPEVIQDGVTGLLANPLNAEEIAHKIIELASRPDKTREMGRAAREQTLRKFDFTRLVDLFEKEVST